MNDIQLILDPKTGRGSFLIKQGADVPARMDISIVKENLTVFHTEVGESLRGQGIAGKLVAAMVEHARQNNLKVIPLCPYTLAEFNKHPDQYQDIWNKDWHKS